MQVLFLKQLTLTITEIIAGGLVLGLSVTTRSYYRSSLKVGRAVATISISTGAQNGLRNGRRDNASTAEVYLHCNNLGASLCFKLGRLGSMRQEC